MRKQRTEPGPGQESVWDYPRPPALESVSEHIRVEFGGEIIADTNRAMRVLETSHPPTYYIPPEDVNFEFLEETSRNTMCEFKGRATYYTVRVGDRVAENAAWAYPDPTPKFRDIQDYVTFYASKMDACYVGDEKVQAQEGDFYGGWITSKVVGPFKGGSGTWGW
ncbi:MAG: DUF427 domain-containing protein [Trueperaceae bacterium]|nr:DUF427 domain-containing protein [Trueperaceae bacterium]